MRIPLKFELYDEDKQKETGLTGMLSIDPGWDWETGLPYAKIIVPERKEGCKTKLVPTDKTMFGYPVFVEEEIE